MIAKLWARVRPAILWGYRRGSWQYDVIVILILVFIFLIPRSAFNDRPSAAVVQEVAAPSTDLRVFWVDPGALDRANPEEAAEHLEDLLRDSRGEGLRIVRTEPALDAVGNVRGFLVYAKQ